MKIGTKHKLRQDMTSTENLNKNDNARDTFLMLKINKKSICFNFSIFFSVLSSWKLSI